MSMRNISSAFACHGMVDVEKNATDICSWKVRDGKMIPNCKRVSEFFLLSDFPSSAKRRTVNQPELPRSVAVVRHRLTA